MLQSEVLLETGSVQVTISPAGAVTAGAQWSVDGGTWQNSGATLTGVQVGSHIVNYSTVTGWVTPASAPVTVANGLYTLTGTYTPAVGNLTITLQPSAARTGGAQWQVDGSGWHNSGATVSGLAAGARRSATAACGWNPPAAEVTVINGSTATTDRTYVTAIVRQRAGDAVAGGRSHRRGQSGTWTAAHWQNSGATVTGLDRREPTR